MMIFLQALLLGILEGATEFLPVSSTAHLLLAGRVLGFVSPHRTFEVLIQLGAISALLGVYAARLMNLLLRLRHDPLARQFIVTVLLAFLPAALLGALGHKVIKGFFENPLLICTMLVVGGVVLIAVDRLSFRSVVHDVEQLGYKRGLLIGICQCLAMIPGVSRSGATVVSALFLGCDKRTAAEFSFFLAMPTMTGAFVYDLYKSHGLLTLQDGAVIGVGFLAAFVSGLIVVRSFLHLVSTYGFTPFGWWRILVGSFGFGFFLVG